jgi:hypothetical protein
VSDLHYSGQEWIADAIAGQEEHIKRSHSCMGQLGLPHRFVDRDDWRECERCGVTETSKDHEKRKAHG